MKNNKHLQINTLKKTSTFIALFFFSTFLAFSQNKKIKIYLVGDSTMCLYDESRFPQEGWGMPFAKFFNNAIKVQNHAKGGRSSRSFIAENRWQPIVNSLQAGDYVLIQFGHNDAQNSKSHPDRKTTPKEYKKYLEKYIIESRNKNASPILISPVTRWKFDSNGKAEESHAPYLKAVKEVAKKHNVTFIDLDTKSRELLDKMGKASSRYLFMYFEPNEYFRFPKGYPDNTHFSEFGARKMAEIVLKEIQTQKLELANYIIKPYVKK